MKEFDRLVEIIARLRDPIDGCPWDLEQTPKSLVPNFIEELYETVEAIEDNDPESLKEELGDLMLHVLMQCRIGEENKEFTVQESLDGISDKLISRHPHIFGDETAKDAETVLMNWERIKQVEKKKVRDSVLDGTPLTMPALIVSHRIQEKAASQGFDWDSIEPIYGKIVEETEEIKEAIIGGNQDKIEEEIGDLLFSVVNLARRLKVDSESALRITINKFIRRFKYVEKTFAKNGKMMYEATLKELDEVWDEAKRTEA
ncbi:MAG: nucleoside triphosphate pyrophosphohydrolase [Candidatus Zophobacter franzmannii]|nr:nucleoside triphosphate pyrophosphohydrolase [Candidatus Zophobacter franzmannii]